MKNFLKITFTLLILLIVSSYLALSSKPDELYANNGLGAEEINYMLQKSYNKDLTLKIAKEFHGNVEEKYDIPLNEIRKNAKVQLNLKFSKVKSDDSNRDAEVVGSVNIGKRNYGFQGQGDFIEFIDTETNDIYYYGVVFGDLKGINMNEEESNYTEFDGHNSVINIMFSPSNNKAFIAVGSGFADYTSHIIFGELMNSGELLQKYVLKVGAK